MNKGANTDTKTNDGKTMAVLASEAKSGIVLDKLDWVNKLRQNEFKNDENKNENKGLQRFLDIATGLNSSFFTFNNTSLVYFINSCIKINTH